MASLKFAWLANVTCIACALLEASAIDTDDAFAYRKSAALQDETSLIQVGHVHTGKSGDMKLIMRALFNASPAPACDSCPGEHPCKTGYQGRPFITADLNAYITEQGGKVPETAEAEDKEELAEHKSDKKAIVTGQKENAVLAGQQDAALAATEKLQKGKLDAKLEVLKEEFESNRNTVPVNYPAQRAQIEAEFHAQEDSIKKAFADKIIAEEQAQDDEAEMVAEAEDGSEDEEKDALKEGREQEEQSDALRDLNSTTMHQYTILTRRFHKQILEWREQKCAKEKASKASAPAPSSAPAPAPSAPAASAPAPSSESSES